MAGAIARPWPVPWPGALARPIRSAPPLADAVKAWIGTEIDRRRLFPWLAVFFGLGIILFFAAEGRPSPWAPAVGALACGIGALMRRHHLASFAALTAGTMIFAGFGAAWFRTDQVQAPVLQRLTLGPISGFLESVETRPEGARVVVIVHTLANLAPHERPRRVRLTTRQTGTLAPGTFVTGRARVLPPPEASRPGGYDFAREAYYRGLGGVGSVLGALNAAPAPIPPGFDLSLSAAVDAARNALTRRIADAVGGQAGAVAAALVTGKRGLIDEATNEALRAAGLYHIISISGLHMALAATTVFWLVRALLALSPTYALTWPCKKLAALAAMGAATAYCLFSGSEVSTERSLVMTLVMLGAILVDRPALSMRNLSLAALIVLAREPETLLGPSFQMSFAAVAALIAAAEWWQQRPRRTDGLKGQGSRALSWVKGAVLGMLATTLIASMATAPFGAHHFQTANPFGLIGNGLALPLVSLVVMPCAVLGALAYPFGLDRPIWWMMGLAVEGVLRVSSWVEAFQGSTLVTPAFGAGALGLLALGLIVGVLFVTPLRFLAIVPAAAGFTLAASPQRADLYVDGEGTGAAVRAVDGRLVVLGRPGDFTLEQWLKADGDGRAADDPTLTEGILCDGLGCVSRSARGGPIAYVRDPRAFAEDCARARVVVTRLTAPKDCAALTIDRAFLDSHGATTITWTATEPTIVSTRRQDDERPWIRRPAPKRRTPPAPRRPDEEQSASEPDASDQ